MAQKHTVHYVSDLSGKEIKDSDKPTVRFGWDGVDYTIDLTGEEAEKFYNAVSKYLEVATRSTSAGGGRRRSAAASTGPSAADVRAWAQQHGHDVPERGRIPSAVREAYDAAN